MDKTFSKEFKFKVGIEAIRDDLTIAEIISKYPSVQDGNSWVKKSYFRQWLFSFWLEKRDFA